MGLYYDLHTHSTASDGTLPPGELVRCAVQAGVDVLALTDHDTTAGIGVAAEAAQGTRVGLVAGVEVSVTWRGRVIHIVGLHVDPACAELQQGLCEIRNFRAWRAEEIGRRLQKEGIPGAYEGAKAYACGAIIGRTHFARYLVERGYARDLREVFKRYLVRNKPGHVPGQWARLEQALAWIHGAGGLAVIAHPARYGLNPARLRELLGAFAECGGVGLEVVSGSHSRDDYYTMARYARQFDLLASSGSDYHGPDNPWIELGRLPGLPPGCTPIWYSDRWPLTVESPPRFIA